MENVATAILVTLFMLGLFGLTIFVHEFGHYLAARALGLVVDVFSIGFGPAIVKKRINGILYKIGCIPLGGYVALPQLDPAAMESVQSSGKKDSDSTPEERRRDLPDVAPWRKIVVSLAGAFGNVVLALLLAWIVWMHPGAVGGMDNTVGHVDPDSPAYAAGLRPGHKILAVNDEAIATWNEFQIESHLSVVDDAVRLSVASPENPDETTVLQVAVTNLSSDLRGIAGVLPAAECVFLEVLPDTPAERAGLENQDILVALDDIPVVGSRHFVSLVKDRGEEPLRLQVLREGETLHFTVTPQYNPEFERMMLGVELADMQRALPPWLQFRRPGAQLAHDAKGIFRLLRALVAPRSQGESGRAAGALGGPLMIMVTLWMSVKAGLISSVGFMRFLNVNLAILNLLPIPVLDGGHIVFALWEMTTRRKPNARFVNWLVNIFAILLIGAVLLISRNDVARLWRIFRNPASVQGNASPEENGEEDKAEAELDRDSPEKRAEE